MAYALWTNVETWQKILIWKKWYEVLKKDEEGIEFKEWKILFWEETDWWKNK